jgi:TM2 domain-containing membrane protein YozV
VLFGIGKLLLGSALEGLVYLAVGAASATLIYIHIMRYGWERKSP